MLHVFVLLSVPFRARPLARACLAFFLLQFCSLAMLNDELSPTGAGENRDPRRCVCRSGGGGGGGCEGGWGRGHYT